MISYILGFIFIIILVIIKCYSGQTHVHEPEYFMERGEYKSYPDPPCPHTRSELIKRSNFRVGIAHTQGIRDSMEDAIKVYEFDDSIHVGLYDGHNGYKVAEYAAKYMPKILDRQLNTSKPEHALIMSFAEVESQIELNPKIDSRKIGSTALVAHIKPLSNSHGRGWLANLGDSRSILLTFSEKNYKITELSTDHKPDLPVEQKRIIAKGGFVTAPGTYFGSVARLDGLLAVSRSLGDTEFGEKISHVPDIKEFNWKTGDIVIMACDGVWDVLTNEEAADIVWKSFSYKGDIQEAAEQLRNAAIAKNSSDNVSVALILL